MIKVIEFFRRPAWIWQAFVICSRPLACCGGASHQRLILPRLDSRWCKQIYRRPGAEILQDVDPICPSRRLAVFRKVQAEST